MQERVLPSALRRARRRRRSRRSSATDAHTADRRPSITSAFSNRGRGADGGTRITVTPGSGRSPRVTRAVALDAVSSTCTSRPAHRHDAHRARSRISGDTPRATPSLWVSARHRPAARRRPPSPTRAHAAPAARRARCLRRAPGPGGDPDQVVELLAVEPGDIRDDGDDQRPRADFRSSTRPVVSR